MDCRASLDELRHDEHLQESFFNDIEQTPELKMAIEIDRIVKIKTTGSYQNIAAIDAIVNSDELLYKIIDLGFSFFGSNDSIDVYRLNKFKETFREVLGFDSL
jgi:hypothetical protein